MICDSNEICGISGWRGSDIVFGKKVVNIQHTHTKTTKDKRQSMTDNERNHEKDNEKQQEAGRAGFPLWP